MHQNTNFSLLSVLWDIEHLLWKGGCRTLLDIDKVTSNCVLTTFFLDSLLNFKIAALQTELDKILQQILNTIKIK